VASSVVIMCRSDTARLTQALIWPFDVWRWQDQALYRSRSDVELRKNGTPCHDTSRYNLAHTRLPAIR
jgi:hypothetical protein